MNTFYSGKQIVVTGGAGFIGSHLVDALTVAGANVTVIDNLQSGLESNLSKSIASIRFVQADVRDRNTVFTEMEGADLVFHLAGNAFVPYSIENPCYDFEANVLGTFNVLQAQIDGRIGRVLFASSAAVYGVPKYTPTDEHHPLEPISPYGASKLAAERLGIAYARSLDLDVVVARIFNTFGPRQRKYVMYDLLMKLHKDPSRLEVLGDGSQVRDYIFVGDTVRALMTIMERGKSGEAYNIAGNNPTTIRALIPALAHTMAINGNLKISYSGKSWRGDIPVMVADITKLRSLGFEPHKPLLAGIKELHDWLETEVWAVA